MSSCERIGKWFKSEEFILVATTSTMVILFIVMQSFAIGKELHFYYWGMNLLAIWLMVLNIIIPMCFGWAMRRYSMENRMRNMEIKWGNFTWIWFGIALCYTVTICMIFITLYGGNGINDISSNTTVYIGPAKVQAGEILEPVKMVQLPISIPAYCPNFKLEVTPRRSDVWGDDATSIRVKGLPRETNKEYDSLMVFDSDETFRPGYIPMWSCSVSCGFVKLRCEFVGEVPLRGNMNKITTIVVILCVAATIMSGMVSVCGYDFLFKFPADPPPAPRRPSVVSHASTVVSKVDSEVAEDSISLPGQPIDLV